MLREFGIAVELQVNTDASAANGIASRRGLGKVRHVEVHQLWVQDAVMKKELIVKKVAGVDNLADAPTKHVNREEIEKHMAGTRQEFRSDRHALSPETVE